VVTIGNCIGTSACINIDLIIEEEPENLNSNVDDLNIYLNPVKDVININSELSLINSISIVDIQGKEHLLITDVSTSNQKIDVSNLVDGVYFLKINSTDGNQSISRIVKMK